MTDHRRVVVAERATGKIVGRASVPLVDIALQAAPGQVAFEVNETIYTALGIAAARGERPFKAVFDENDVPSIAVNDEDQTPPLSDLKSKLLAAVAIEFQNHVDAGHVYDGKTFQINDEARANITAVSVLAILASNGGTPWPDGGYNWIAADNSYYTFSTPQDFITFGTGAAAHYTALRYAFRAIKDAIEALPTADAALAFEVTAGWP